MPRLHKVSALGALALLAFAGVAAFGVLLEHRGHQEEPRKRLAAASLRRPLARQSSHMSTWRSPRLRCCFRTNRVTKGRLCVPVAARRQASPGWMARVLLVAKSRTERLLSLPER